jgi:sec-independent protein translocase protein TatA
VLGENIMQLGPTELIIILVIVIVLFGVGRISKIAGELGTGIRSFREGLQTPEDPAKQEAKPEDQAANISTSSVESAVVVDETKKTEEK